MSNPEPPWTRLTLIRALPQGLRWEEFVALYGRLILFWGRRDFGLQECDAENLRQEVLLKVWKGIAGYDPARGRFRNWLYACTRNAVLNGWHGRRAELPGRRPSEARGPLPTPAAAVPAAWGTERQGGDVEAALERLEEEGFALDGLEEAMRHVRARVQPHSWKAFLLFECFELKAKEIAPRLGMTPAAVNQAVYRIRQLLHEALTVRQPPHAEHQEPRG
jgi:RNA polymerase sigma-70 factor (ECF subfamily)